MKKKKFVKQYKKIRFESGNTSVATVSSTGTIKAAGKGSCYVYAYAQNGLFKKVNITV